MPQMSPMWWTMLMIMFITSFIICMAVMYFNNSNFCKTKKSLTKKNLTWLW
nr:ATP synthase F0 subunit 8 [Aguriahana sp. 1 BY-2021a]